MKKNLLLVLGMAMSLTLTACYETEVKTVNEKGQTETTTISVQQNAPAFDRQMIVGKWKGMDGILEVHLTHNVDGTGVMEARHPGERSMPQIDIKWDVNEQGEGTTITYVNGVKAQIMKTKYSFLEDGRMVLFSEATRAVQKGVEETGTTTFTRIE